MKHSGRRGFTLIELLVVIAIISLLTAILFPVFAQAREKARTTACLSNCKQIGLAFIQYAQDFDENLPLSTDTSRTASWTVTMQPYIKDTQVYVCPDDQSPYWGTPSSGNYRLSSYFLNDWLCGTQPYTDLSTVQAPSSVIYVSESAWSLTRDHFHPFKWVNDDPLYPNDLSTSMFNTATNQTLELQLTVHQGGFNNVYADGHAKWRLWSQVWFQSPGVYEGAFDPRQQ